METNNLAIGNFSCNFSSNLSYIIRLTSFSNTSGIFEFYMYKIRIISELVICDVVITAVLDLFPSLRPWKYKVMVVGGTSLVGFIIGLCLTCPGGSYVLALMDKYAGGWPLVLACLVEICMVAWFYGVGRFIGDISLMLGIPYQRYNWFS